MNDVTEQLDFSPCNHGIFRKGDQHFWYCLKFWEPPSQSNIIYGRGPTNCCEIKNFKKNDYFNDDSNNKEIFGSLIQIFGFWNAAAVNCFFNVPFVVGPFCWFHLCNGFHCGKCAVLKFILIAVYQYQFNTLKI